MDYFARTAVQKGLNEKAQVNPALVIDGVWGGATKAALTKYQGVFKLPATGQYDAATQASLGPFLLQKYLSLESIQQAAKILVVDPKIIVAVALAESSGSGFLQSGDCQIRFERHKMYASLLKKYGIAQTTKWANQYPNIVNASIGGYLGGQQEYSRLNQAMALDPGCAQQSTSWGMFQIMGFNYAAAGFPDVVSFVNAQKSSETAQLLSFVTFNQRYLDGVLMQPMRTLDWVKYATYYNGTGNVPEYSKRLTTYYGQAGNYLV